MKGDFSRISFDPANRFSRVLTQQGRVTLDADFNEQADILLRQKLISAMPDWKKALRPDLWAKASA